MVWRHLFRWFFYGHGLIAAAATALSWLSVRLVFGRDSYVAEWPALAFVFFATLGIYTLHRLLSFRRAGERPTSLRYEIVRRHPSLSLAIGGACVCVAGTIALLNVSHLWGALLWALPITVFYLTPPLPGWRRLRDLPYLKGVWVGLAWSLVTVEMPVRLVGAALNAADTGGILLPVAPGSPGYPFAAETGVRFLFTLAIALLFDFRDVQLDRSQGVRTVAGDYPGVAKSLVAAALLVCVLAVLLAEEYHGRPWLAAAYAAVLLVAALTHERRSEDWYAVMVNGALLFPPLFYACALILGADAGAEGGL